jgi:hypothetical protein
MSLTTSLLFAIATYSLVTFFLLPAIRVAWKSEHRPQKIMRAGALIGLEVLSRLTFVAALTLLAIAAAIGLFSVFAPLTAGSVQSSLRGADIVLAALSTVKSGWTQFLFVFSFALAGFLYYRISRRQLEEAFRKSFERELQRLEKARSLGSPEWASLRPTAEMEELVKAGRTLRETIQQLPPGSSEKALFEEALAKVGAKLAQLDLERRINVDVEVEGQEEHKTWLTHHWAKLTSAGFASDLKGVTAFLRTAASVLLLCLASVTSESVSQGISDRALQLKDLRIQLLLKEAQETRKNLPTEASPNSDVAATEEAGLQVLSREFEDTLKNDPIWDRVSIAPRNTQYAAQMRADWVRVAVRLKDVPEQAETSRSTQLFPPDQWGSDHDIAFEYARTQTLPSVTSIQKSFIQNWKKENVRQIKDMSRKLREMASMRKPDYDKQRSWSDLHEWALGEVIAAALDGILPEMEKGTGSEAEKASSKATEEALQTYYKIRFNQFVIAFARGGLDEAKHSFTSKAGESQAIPERLLSAIGDSAHPESYSQVSEKLRAVIDRTSLSRSESSHWVRSTEIADALATSPAPVLHALRLGNLDRLAGSFVQYSSDFPASKDEPRTKASLKKRWAIPESDEDLKNLIANSKDFKRQENNPEAGGILLGRPENGSGNLAGLQWSFSGDQILLEIRDANGAKFALGPYPATLAYQALLYATDDRPVAVTEIPDFVTGRHKLTVHPALADTVFGSHLIRIDQWIFDSFRSADRKHLDAITGAALAQIAEYDRIGIEMFARVKKSNKDKRGKPISPGSRVSFTISNSAPFLALPESSSPLLKNQDVFDGSLVKSIFDCIHKASSQDPCYASLPKELRLFATDRILSQIRESDYDISSGLSFLSDRDPHKASIFDFKILVPLTGVQSWYIDDAQLQPPALEPRVLAHVRHEGQTSYLTELTEFTLMQRFFRSALHGKFGEAFPVEKISKLADVLIPFAPKTCITARWEKEPPPYASPFELQFASVLSKYIEQAEKLSRQDASPLDPSIPGSSLLQRMKLCRDTIHRAKGPLSDEQWSTSCNFENTQPLLIYPATDSADYGQDKNEKYQFSDLITAVNKLRSLRSELLAEGGTNWDCPTSASAVSHN